MKWLVIFSICYSGVVAFGNVEAKNNSDKFVAITKLENGNVVFKQCNGNGSTSGNCLNGQIIGRAEGYPASFLDSQRNEEYAKAVGISAGYLGATALSGGVGLIIGNGVSYGSSAALTFGGAGAGILVAGGTLRILSKFVEKANPMTYKNRGRLISKDVIQNKPVIVNDINQYVSSLGKFLGAIEKEMPTSQENNQVESSLK